jgi:predicted dehydrogenase
VFATLANYNREGDWDRSFMVIVAFANGVMGHIWLSYEVPDPVWKDSSFRARVVGSTGNLDAEGYGFLMLGRDHRWETVFEQTPIDYINRPMERSRLEAFFEMTQDFIDAVREDREPPVTGQDGLAAVALVEAGVRSNALGQAVELALV